MKAVVVSDLHPDASTGGLPRFDDVKEALDEAVEHAIKIKADCFIFAGDLLTNDPPLHVAIRCGVMLDRTAVRVTSEGMEWFAIPGNHDVFEDGLGTTALDMLAFEDRVVKQPSLRIVYKNLAAGIVFLPFVPSSHAYDPTEACERLARDAHHESVDVKLVVGHLNLEGINSGSEVNDFPRGRDVFYPIEAAKRCFPKAVLVCGHVHERQTYRGVEVVGSLVNLTKGEIDNRPGFLVIDV